MKFIPKKAPGGLVQRYLDANPYTITTKPTQALPFLKTQANTTVNPTTIDSTYNTGKTVIIAPPVQPIVMPSIQNALEAILKKPSPSTNDTFIGPPISPISQKLVAKPKANNTTKPAVAPTGTKVNTQADSKPNTTSTGTTAKPVAKPVAKSTTKPTSAAASKPALKPKTSATTKPASKSEVTYKGPDLPVTEIKTTRLKPKPKVIVSGPNKMHLTNAQVVNAAKHIDRFELDRMLPADADRVRSAKATLDAKAKEAKLISKKTSGPKYSGDSYYAGLQRVALNDRVSDITLKAMYKPEDYNKIMAVRNAARRAKK